MTRLAWHFDIENRDLCSEKWVTRFKKNIHTSSTARGEIGALTLLGIFLQEPVQTLLDDTLSCRTSLTRDTVSTTIQEEVRKCVIGRALRDEQAEQCLLTRLWRTTRSPFSFKASTYELEVACFDISKGYSLLYVPHSLLPVSSTIILL